MLQARAGYVKERPDGILPIYEKFTLGGISNVRGYKFGSISPIDPATGDKIGGEKMWVYNLEYQFPLVKDQGIRGVVFYDAGNVFSKDEEWEFKAKRSVGLGIRWYSPVGPLRIEYGHKLDRATGETSGEWEFMIGSSF
jgi:outer membrane protein insertion porin family